MKDLVTIIKHEPLRTDVETYATYINCGLLSSTSQTFSDAVHAQPDQCQYALCSTLSELHHCCPSKATERIVPPTTAKIVFTSDP